MSFEDRLAKGKIGEQIVEAYLLAQGYVPYRPIEGVAHPFDRLVASRDKRNLAVFEIKTKPRREAFKDTGIPERHYHDYQHIYFTYNIPVFIAFVDENMAEVYGNFISELMKTDENPGRRMKVYPSTETNRWGQSITYFPLSRMITITKLTPEQCAELRALRKSGWTSTQCL
jgi:hypothetical protein